MKPWTPSCALLFLALSGCGVPDQHSAFVAPGGSRWVEVETVAPAPGSDELQPTQRLSLRSRWRPGSRVVLDGLESLCGTTVQWTDARHLYLRVSADRVGGLQVHDGDTWGGTTVQVLVHTDQVVFDRPSPDGQLRLVLIKNCESEDWNLYLRRAGEPPYNEAMQQGWDDPDLFGGLGYTQPPLSLTWTDRRNARLEVPGKRYGVTLKTELGGVHVDWVFKEHYKLPQPQFQQLAPLKETAK